MLQRGIRGLISNAAARCAVPVGSTRLTSGRPCIRSKFYTTSPVNVEALEITLPSLTRRMKKGKLAKWWISEGQEFKEGDVLFSVELEFGTIDLDSPAAGILSKIITPAGTDDVPVDTVVGYMDSLREENDFLHRRIRELESALLHARNEYESLQKSWIQEGAEIRKQIQYIELSYKERLEQSKSTYKELLQSYEILKRQIREKDAEFEPAYAELKRMEEWEHLKKFAAEQSSSNPRSLNEFEDRIRRLFQQERNSLVQERDDARKEAEHWRKLASAAQNKDITDIINQNQQHFVLMEQQSRLQSALEASEAALRQKTQELEDSRAETDEARGQVEFMEEQLLAAHKSYNELQEQLARRGGQGMMPLHNPYSEPGQYQQQNSYYQPFPSPITSPAAPSPSSYQQRHQQHQQPQYQYQQRVQQYPSRPNQRHK